MKSIILCAMLFSGFLYGMESNLQSAMITYNTVPPIMLIKDAIYRRMLSKPADITIAGKTEESIIQGVDLEARLVEGDVVKSKYNTLLLPDSVLKKHLNYRFRCPDDSISMVIEGKRFDISNADDFIDEEGIEGLFLVVEPMINGMIGQETDYVYNPYRRIIEDGSTKLVVAYNYYGQEALSESKKGLGLCYTNALEGVWRELSEKNEKKSIAFPALSTLLGMPRKIAAEVALASVMQFIEKSVNRDKYSEIQFVLEQEEDFEFYKELLNQKIHSIISKS